jgi:hypothetical protein
MAPPSQLWCSIRCRGPGDGVHLERARERRSPGAEHGGVASGVDRSTGGGPGAQPAVRLRRQIHPAPRAQLRRAGEPLHARTVSPLRGGASQFAPNAISQAATFVGVCEGFLGIPVNWDLWVHLCLHTLATAEARVRRAVRAGGLSISLWDSRREFYIPCTMTSNNEEWERGWFYLRNDGADLPPTPARCYRRRLTPGTTACLLLCIRRGVTLQYGPEAVYVCLWACVPSAGENPMYSPQVGL